MSSDSTNGEAIDRGGGGAAAVFVSLKREVDRKQNPKAVRAE